MRNHEMTEGPLLDGQGKLAECGYAKKLVKQYDRNAIKAKKSRIKEWDYYYIGNDEFGVALTIDDNTYMGLVGASFLDFTAPKEKTVNVITPFTGGKTNLPPTSAKGNVGVRGKRIIAEFLNDGNERILRFLVKKFNEEGDFFVDVTLKEQEGGESMVIATPFPGKDKAFYYNQKIIGMSASGKVKLGNRELKIDPETSLGLLDWG
ncbi:MAG: DUF2804 domain-containing protein, partial [Lachnospiraceae bacterium]|nr:DUF2804 domain-containing protein [Lachnospiraceae bacterium]